MIPLPTKIPLRLILKSPFTLYALIRRARSGMNLPAYDYPARNIVLVL